MAKVLLVEDDNNLREIYEARLQAEGYEIVSASDGEQALVVAKNEKPDLVISDVMMPKISGFEMLDILHNTDGLQDVKVIMLTALGQAEDKTRADQLGANRYLVKSQVTLEDIVKTAHQLLDDKPANDAAPAAAADSTTATPSDDAPAADPATTPAAASTPTSNPIATTTASKNPADDDNAETMAQEEAEMAAQISNFEQQTSPSTVEPAATTSEAVPTPSPAEEAASATPEPVASAPAVVAAPEPAGPSGSTDVPAAKPEPAASSASQNDQTMADAVKSLTTEPDQKPSDVAAVEVAPDPPETTPVATVAATTPTAPATSTPSSEASESGNDAVTIGHKKVIKPISDLSADKKPDINELLAAEEAKSAAVKAEAEAAAILATSAPTTPVATPDPAPAAPVIAPPPAETTPAPAPVTPAVTPDEAPIQPPAPGTTIDPNSIAL